MENGILRTVVLVILGIICAMVVINIVKGLLGMLMPLMILGAVGYGVYRLTRPKGIHGGRGGILP